MQLRVLGSGIREWSLSGELAVRSDEPTHQVVLPASVSLDTPLKPSYAPGDTVPVRLTWQPFNKIDAYSSASVRIVDAQGNKIVNLDREPAGQTLQWTPDVPVRDEFTLTLPSDLASGTYSLQVLMYQPLLGVDALLLDSKDRPQPAIVLARFEVKK